MNIFVLDMDYKKAAQYHVDKHIVKMPLETAQIVCTAIHKNSDEENPELYRKAYKNHPCVKWAAKNRSNFMWLIEFGYELFKEYEFRYGRQHKSFHKLYLAYKKADCIPQGPRTEFALAMPDKYMCDDPVKSYRDYYVGEKSHLASWKKRNTPFWWSTGKS